MHFDYLIFFSLKCIYYLSLLFLHLLPAKMSHFFSLLASFTCNLRYCGFLAGNLLNFDVSITSLVSVGNTRTTPSKVVHHMRSANGTLVFPLFSAPHLAAFSFVCRWPKTSLLLCCMRLITATGRMNMLLHGEKYKEKKLNFPIRIVG